MINSIPNVKSIEFPESMGEDNSQDEEFFILEEENNEKKKIRFHDYHEIYNIPGLYEFLFYQKLQCKSPQTVTNLLHTEMQKTPVDISELVVLDVGAGNGMMGEELSNIGIKSVVGIDIIEEAAVATERDRPDVYDDYIVADLTQMSEITRAALEKKKFNCLTSVSALGFGDIPPLAFSEAFNLVSTPGWIAFNIKDKFVSEQDSTGFSRLIDRIVDDRIMEFHAKHRYCHRMSMDGSPLYYVAIVGRKMADIPAELMDEVQ